jgi:hypothetical protein
VYDMTAHLALTRRRLVLAAMFVLVLLAGAVGFALWRASLEQRFARSKPALEAYAAQVMAAAPTAPVTPPRRLGAFEASEGMRLPHGFLFRSNFGHPLDWNGLAYSTAPLPREMADPQRGGGRMFFDRIGGNWYTVWRE